MAGFLEIIEHALEWFGIPVNFGAIPTDWVAPVATWLLIGLIVGMISRKFFYRECALIGSFLELVKTVFLGLVGSGLAILAGVYLGLPGATRFSPMLIVLAVAGTILFNWLIRLLVR